MKHFMDEVISLNGQWRLYYVKDRILREDGYRDRTDDSLSTPMLSTEQALIQAGYPCIRATVPGNYELSLFEAGICEDPFYGDNIEKMQAYECDHQYYVRRFSAKEAEGMELVFEGIDTAAEVFLNGEQLLACENMFIAHTVPLKKELLRESNELIVHIKPAVLYAQKYQMSAHEFALRYNYESLHLRKAASSFGWDIMPRLCGGGIWRSVYLRRRPQAHIRHVFCYTVDADPQIGKATLCFRYSLHSDEDSLVGWRLEIEGHCEESSFSRSEELRFSEGHVVVSVDQAKLWMPRNYGSPWLYDVELRLMRGDRVMDACQERIGIRTVGLDRTSVISPSGEGEFAFSVNGQRIFVLGTNWVPADAFHSRAAERLEERLPLLTELGCNMVRCWGGNAYEDEKLFDFCDENGILIWQDFAMACGVYPQDEAFCRRLEQEILAVVRTYRNHPSLILWAGDNECDLAHGWGGGLPLDPNRNRLTRQIIPQVLQREDQSRPYLPSSPYVDGEAYQTGLPTAEDHIWGPRDYFKGAFYRSTVCRFASEVGYHGCPEPNSLKQFLSEEYLWNWRDREGRKTQWNGVAMDAANPQWLLHASCMERDPNSPYAYRIPLMTSQIVTLFGREPRDLETYSAMSQISQAEAKKYFIESFRIDREHRRGIIWWNLVDGWPQISDAVVDYYGRKKRAFDYIKRSQRPMALMCDEPRDGEIGVYAVNDLREAVSFDYRVTDLTCGQLCLQGRATVKSDQSLKIAAIPHKEGDQRFYLLEWESDGEKGLNHYVSGMEQTVSYEEYMRCAGLAGI